MLKTDAARWELCATKNELCVVELNDRLKQLRLELLDRKIRFENTKVTQLQPCLTFTQFVHIFRAPRKSPDQLTPSLFVTNGHPNNKVYISVSWLKKVFGLLIGRSPV